MPWGRSGTMTPRRWRESRRSARPPPRWVSSARSSEAVRPSRSGWNGPGRYIISRERRKSMGVDVNIRVTGGAGQGVHTVGGLLCRLAIAAGHHFHATQDYMSRIRGGRNSYSVRIREIPVRAGRGQVDIALSLDPGHLPHILSSLAPAGIVVCDLPAGAAESADPRVIAAPLKELAVSSGSPILANIVGAGIIARALGIAPETVDTVLSREFKGDFLEKNRVAARLGSEWAEPRVA